MKHEKRAGLDAEAWALVRDIRAAARDPKGHGFKRRKAESHRKVWGFPPLSAATRARRGKGY